MDHLLFRSLILHSCQVKVAFVLSIITGVGTPAFYLWCLGRCVQAMLERGGLGRNARPYYPKKDFLGKNRVDSEGVLHEITAMILNFVLTYVLGYCYFLYPVAQFCLLKIQLLKNWLKEWPNNLLFLYILNKTQSCLLETSFGKQK